MNEDKAEIDLIEPPIVVSEVDKDKFLFYLAGQVPVAVSQFAEDCTESEPEVKNTLNSRFQNEIKLDHTGFLTLTDAARSNILSFANPLISDAVAAQKRGKSIVEDGDYKDAIEHYRHAESLFSEAESRLGAVGDVPEKLTRRLESVRDTHDSIQKKAVNDVLTHRKFVGEQHEEKGDDAMHNNEFAEAVDEFEDAVDAFKEAKAAVEKYNSQLLSPDSSGLDQSPIESRIDGLRRKLEAAKDRVETDLDPDTSSSQKEDKAQSENTESQSGTEEESTELSNAEAVADSDSAAPSADNQSRAELISELQELDREWSEIDRKLLYSISDYHPDDFEEEFGSVDAALIEAGVIDEPGEDKESDNHSESTSAETDDEFEQALVDAGVIDEPGEGKETETTSQESNSTGDSPDPDDFAAISDMQPNKRFSGELAIKLESESYAGAKKDAAFEVTDASGETVRLDFWSKHGLDIPESTGTWYVMKELRLQQWEKDGETNRNLSSSRDTQWRQIGNDDSTGSRNSEDDQAKATGTASQSESATETQEASDESGGMLGSIVSEFDDDLV